MTNKMFSILTKQVNVLRQIALERPRAHLAFLFHAPYRKLYANAGQDGQLADYWGQWQISYCTERIFCIHYKLNHNEMSYHPLHRQIDCYTVHMADLVLLETSAALRCVVAIGNVVYLQIYPLHRKQIQRQHILDGKSWETYDMTRPEGLRRIKKQRPDEFLNYVKIMYKKLTNKEFIAYIFPHACGRLEMIAANI